MIFAFLIGLAFDLLFLLPPVSVRKSSLCTRDVYCIYNSYLIAFTRAMFSLCGSFRKRPVTGSKRSVRLRTLRQVSRSLGSVPASGQSFKLWSALGSGEMKPGSARGRTAESTAG